MNIFFFAIKTKRKNVVRLTLKTVLLHLPYWVVQIFNETQRGPVTRRREERRQTLSQGPLTDSRALGFIAVFISGPGLFVFLLRRSAATRTGSIVDDVAGDPEDV